MHRMTENLRARLRRRRGSDHDRGGLDLGSARRVKTVGAPIETQTTYRKVPRVIYQLRIYTLPMTEALEQCATVPSFAGQPSSRHSGRESARRPPEDLPIGSDVPAQTRDHSASDSSLADHGQIVPPGRRQPRALLCAPRGQSQSSGRRQAQPADLTRRRQPTKTRGVAPPERHRGCRPQALSRSSGPGGQRLPTSASAASSPRARR
jgi:hypothetical protein